MSPFECLDIWTTVFYVDNVDKRKARGEDTYTQEEITKVKERRKKQKNIIKIGIIEEKIKQNM